MNSKFKYYWLLVLIPIIFIFWFFVSQEQNKPIRYLPYYGPKNSLSANDTNYHTLPEFNFINQYNEVTNQKSVNGKIFVAEYFFTTCKSICPIMNNNLEKIYSIFKNKKDFLILSHTVNPEVDSVNVLMNYAITHRVKDKSWLFLTGKKSELYSLARKGYILNAEEENDVEDDFIHTQNFALIDKEMHIRGYYDGTDSADIERLVKEIKLLYKEYDYKTKINN